jgi:succinate dehydrogenase/fumarate reductase cytochrome b subunit
MDLFSAKIAYASSTTLNGFITNVDSMIVNPLITLLFALAVVYFLYGVFEFLLNQTNEDKKTSGKSHMLWGIIGITIMLGVWAILSIILNTFGLSGQIQINQNTSSINLTQ